MNKKVLISTSIVIFILVVVALIPLFKLGPFHQPPSLTLDEPKYEAKSVIISGKTDPGLSVFFDGVPVQVSTIGSFSSTVAGDSRILTVVAVDKNGARTTKDVNIVPSDSTAKVPADASADNSTQNTSAPVQPAQSAPVTSQPAPSPTLPTNTTSQPSPPADTTPPPLTVFAPTLSKDPRVSIGGITEAGAQVSVSGINTTAGSDGRFSITVTLAAEGTNQLTVTASDKAGNKTAVNVGVTLDTLPPKVVLQMKLPSGQLTEVPKLTN